MIRINLARNRVDVQGGDMNLEVDSEGREQLKVALVKILILAIFPGLLIFMEKYNLDNLRLQMAQVSAQASQITAETQQKTQELNQLKAGIPGAESAASKLRLLGKMSKLRLRELISLDVVQSVIPERVWLKNLTFQNEQYSFKGGAAETSDLSEFVSKLEASAYFKDVIVIQDKESSTGGKGREFELSATVEGSK